MRDLLVILLIGGVLIFIVYFFVAILKKRPRSHWLSGMISGFFLSLLALILLGIYYPKTPKESPPTAITEEPTEEPPTSAEAPLKILNTRIRHLNYADITRAVYDITIPKDTMDAQFRTGIREFILSEYNKKPETDGIAVHAYYPGNILSDMPIANVIWAPDGKWENIENALHKSTYRFTFLIYDNKHKPTDKLIPLQ
jgi:energy-coupling factor transporter transmembrane protein EcfT